MTSQDRPWSSRVGAIHHRHDNSPSYPEVVVMDNSNGTYKPVQFSLSTGLDYNTGVSMVKLRVGQTELNLMADAAAQIALELLSASYKARTMADLHRYAKEHNLSMKDLGL